MGKLKIKYKNKWMFYGEDHSGNKTIHFIKECKKPESTKEYKEMMHLLENNTYQIVGYMISTPNSYRMNILK